MPRMSHMAAGPRDEFSFVRHARTAHARDVTIHATHNTMTVGVALHAVHDDTPHDSSPPCSFMSLKPRTPHTCTSVIDVR